MRLCLARKDEKCNAVDCLPSYFIVPERSVSFDFVGKRKIACPRVGIFESRLYIRVKPFVHTVAL